VKGKFTPFSELMKKIAAGEFVYTGELEPHKTTDISETIEWARTLKATGKVTAANVTDNPSSTACISSLVAAYIIQRETGLETIYQLRTADRNRLALVSDVLGAGALGLKNILALTGDHTMLGDNPQSKPVFDLDGTQLIAMIKQMVYEGKDPAGNEIANPPKINVGAAAQPGADPLEMEILKMERKVEAGAEFFQTQVVFDVEVALKFLDEASHLNVPILIGIFPPKNYGQAEYFSKYVPGVTVPDQFLADLKKLSEISDKAERKRKINEYNVEYFSNFIREIKKKPVCKGCHIMAVGYPEVIGPIVERVEKGA